MNKAVEYAEKVINNKVVAPKYVKIQAEKFLDIWENKDKKYCINHKTEDLI